jgi:hypothetical protein
MKAKIDQLPWLRRPGGEQKKSQGRLRNGRHRSVHQLTAMSVPLADQSFFVASGLCSAPEPTRTSRRLLPARHERVGSVRSARMLGPVALEIIPGASKAGRPFTVSLDADPRRGVALR